MFELVLRVLVGVRDGAWVVAHGARQAGRPYWQWESVRPELTSRDFGSKTIHLHSGLTHILQTQSLLSSHLSL